MDYLVAEKKYRVFVHAPWGNREKTLSQTCQSRKVVHRANHRKHLRRVKGKKRKIVRWYYIAMLARGFGGFWKMFLHAHSGRFYLQSCYFSLWQRKMSLVEQERGYYCA
jgi:hypothetical protein